MAERSSAPALNENQARHLLGVLTHVEELLASLEAAAGSSRSPFARTRPDLAPNEAKLLASFVALARRRMVDACDRLGVPRPTPSTSARWNVETSLVFAEISFSDLEPATMSGYGPLPPRAAEELAGVARALQRLMRRGVALLHESDGLDLARRAERIDGVIGEALRSLERVVSSRGLVEIRPLLAAAVDRALTATLDVGVFGRVSSGKSSLLDALLGSEVLPVGATPVTAVPLLVSRGAARLEVHTANRELHVVALGQLGDYATEERNPDNEKGVTRLEVFLPDVPEHLRFLDTPGVGSLSATGPAQAFASLPRCDLGIVLVAAGSPVGPDDAALVSGLRSAGIPCELLLSKCDLLVEAERRRALAYVLSEIERELGPGHGVGVRAISTRPGFEPTIAAFRGEVLEPVGSARLRRAVELLERRVRALIAATDAALAGRSDGLAEDVRAERARDRARERIRSITELLAATPANTFEEAADAIASAWAGGHDGRDAATESLRRPAVRAQEAVRQTLDKLREELGGEETEIRVPPVFDPGWLGSLPGLAPPALGRRVVGRLQAAHRIASVESALQESLARFAARLSAWAEGAVERVHGTSVAPALRASGDPELARIEALLAGSVSSSNRQDAAPEPSVHTAVEADGRARSRA